MVKEPILIKTKEELKKDAAKEEYKNLIFPVLEHNLGRLDKKRVLGLLILNRCSNNTQLITNSSVISKRFILFKLSLPKSKSINLAFLLANIL